jgi:DegV family protein with EDD domain
VIALVTDSNALVPADLRSRFGVRVVPLTVVVDGQPYAEERELSTAEFYDRLAAGATVSTAAPSPGQFVVEYEQAAADGANAVLSVHIGSNTSATVNSARLAAAASPIPVEIVDTGTASFPVGCCVWAAGSAIERGEDLAAAAAAASAVAASIGNVFIVGGLDLARRGGRLAPDAEGDEGIPVLALRAGTMDVVGRAHDIEGAIDAMADAVLAGAPGRALRVGVGDAVATGVADGLAARLSDAAAVRQIVRYQVGPSVAAHSGLGTAGAVYFPAELAG